MTRGWTWINEEEIKISDEEYEEHTTLLDALAAQWSAFERERELRVWERQDREERGGDDYDRDEEDENVVSARSAREEVQRLLEEAQVRAVEKKMRELGARMMRPYEHWNEEESLMAYLERDRDGEY